MSFRGRIEVAPDAAAVAAAVAREFESAVWAAVGERGHAAVALAGGKTPRAAYELLAKPTLRDSIPWSRVDLFFGDERCVPADHADSNYRMAREALLDRVPIPASRVHRMEAERADLERAAEEYESKLRAICDAEGTEPPRLDLVLLGMGSDGHTASLFPGSPLLLEAHRMVGVGPGPSGTRRMSLTFPALNAARAVLFAATGADKAPALRAVLRGEPGAPPSASVSPPEGSLHWILDAPLAAAAGL